MRQVLMDLQMPHLNGDEAVQRIADLFLPGCALHGQSPPVVIIQSANVFATPDLLVDELLPKPITLKALRRCLVSAAKRERLKKYLLGRSMEADGSAEAANAAAVDAQLTPPELRGMRGLPPRCPVATSPSEEPPVAGCSATGPSSLSPSAAMGCLVSAAIPSGCPATMPSGSPVAVPSGSPVAVPPTSCPVAVPSGCPVAMPPASCPMAVPSGCPVAMPPVSCPVAVPPVSCPVAMPPASCPVAVPSGCPVAVSSLSPLAAPPVLAESSPSYLAVVPPSDAAAATSQPDCAVAAAVAGLALAAAPPAASAPFHRNSDSAHDPLGDAPIIVPPLSTCPPALPTPAADVDHDYMLQLRTGAGSPVVFSPDHKSSQQPPLSPGTL